LSKAISGSTGPIFTIFFYKIEGICVNVVNPDQFLRFLKGRCHGNQLWGKVGEITSIQHPGILKWIGILHMDKQLYSANDASTSCTNCVNFGPVKPEIEV